MATYPIPAYPQWPSHRVGVVLEGVKYRFRFVWRPRLGAWYVSLYKADNTPLAQMQRLSPGWAPFAGLSIPDGPPGLFVVRGEDEYDRFDLGRSLEFLYIESGDLDFPSATEDFTVKVL